MESDDNLLLEIGRAPSTHAGDRLRAVESRGPLRALPARRRVRLGLGISDAAALLGTLLVVASTGMAQAWRAGDLLLAMVVSVAVQVTVFAGLGLYRRWWMSTWNEFRRLAGATSLWVIVVAIATPWWSGPISRTFLFITWLTGLAFLFSVRALFRWAVRRTMTEEELAMRAAVIGTDPEAAKVAHNLSAVGPELIPVGYVGLKAGDPVADGLPVLGSVEHLESIIDRDAIECIVLPSTGLPDGQVLHVSKVCRRANIEMKVWADLPDILAPRLAIESMDGHVALTLEPARLTAVQAALKRVFDLVAASLGLLVTLPFLLVMALVIRLTSRGPVLFRQDRVTKDGRVFAMYKFRTMVTDPPSALDGETIDLTRPFFKLKDDPRITRVGRLLRHLSLDELPQLLNVIRGDMSIVGPRPLPADQVEANAEFLAPRHEVRGGITGWWQISGRSALDSEQALRLDIWYIENWSIGLDLYILLRTIGAVVARRGAW